MCASHIFSPFMLAQIQFSVCSLSPSHCLGFIMLLLLFHTINIEATFYY